MNNTKLLLHAVDELRKIADSLQSVAEAVGDREEEKTEDYAPSPVKDETKVSIEQVRAVLAEKSLDGKTEQVRELIEKYGANKLSEVDPDKYAAMLPEAEAL